MDFPTLHSWDLKPSEAVQLQIELSSRVDVRQPLIRWELVAGADISYNKFSPTFYASVIIYRVADGTTVEAVDVVRHNAFPYIPGLLSFREAPALLDAFAQLKTRPDIVMIDGQGIAHPRRFGIACHLGLWLGIPTIGCAKSRLCGTYKEPAVSRGSISPLVDHQEQLGHVVRTKDRVKPVFVSPGHLIEPASSARVVLNTCSGYRLPEPTRRAHLRVNELRRSAAGNGSTESL